MPKGASDYRCARHLISVGLHFTSPPKHSFNQSYKLAFWTPISNNGRPLPVSDMPHKSSQRLPPPHHRRSLGGHDAQMPETRALRRAYVWLEGVGGKFYIHEEKRDI